MRVQNIGAFAGGDAKQSSKMTLIDQTVSSFWLEVINEELVQLSANQDVF